jgi:hypothetical protein
MLKNVKTFVERPQVKLAIIVVTNVAATVAAHYVAKKIVDAIIEDK